MLIRILASCCFMMLSLHPTATVADCGPSSNQSKDPDLHVYTFRVTSKSFIPVEIQGSVVFGGIDGYRQIASTTPFEISGTGLTFLAIVASANDRTEVNYTLDVDGIVTAYGGNATWLTIGDNIPWSGIAFGGSN